MATTTNSRMLRLRAIRGETNRVPGSAIVASGALLFISSTLVNAGNYLFNLILGRQLGPAAFADLSLIVTMLLVFSFLTTTLSTVAAKFVSVHEADGNLAALAAVRQWLRQRAIVLGLVVAAALIAGSPMLKDFFQTASIWPFVFLGIGMPLFLDQGVDRGVLQGRTRFRPLAVSYQAEMWTRLLLGIALVAVGLSVNGAVGAIVASFVATWVVVRRAAVGLPAAPALDRDERHRLMTFAVPVIAGLTGQILINNSDVLIVKHFYDRTEAGHYAALALIGRIVFFATWSIATVTFPIVAQRQHKGEPHRIFLWASLGLVFVGSFVLVGVTYGAPDLVVRALFGADYLSISPLLWKYALATTFYTLANVIVTYELSAGRGAGSLLVLISGIVQVAALWIWHDSLAQVVTVQIATMLALLAITTVWSFGIDARQRLIRQPQRRQEP